MRNMKETAFGIVTNTTDPEKRGRIKIKSASITGEPENPTELPDWIEPCLDWGWFYVPDVGEEVEIEFIVESDTGEDTRYQAFLEHPNYRWRGKRAASAGGDAPANVPALLKTNYGKRRGFYTPAGHVLFFDDTDGMETINLVWRGGPAAAPGAPADKRYAFLTFDPDGSVILANRSGSMIYMNAASGQVSLIDEHGNTLTTSETGVTIVDASGGIVKLAENSIQVIGQGNVTINAAGNVALAAQAVRIDAGAVTIGPGANGLVPPPLAQAVAKFDLLKAAFDSHIHPLTGATAGPNPVTGVSAPPATPLPPTVGTSSTRIV